MKSEILSHNNNMTYISSIHSIIPREALKDFSASIRNQGKKLVSTNGCFDILHVGHIKYLEEAKSFGDILIVGVNSDRSARTLKGPGRPIMRDHERAKIIASIYCVDYAVIFDELTPIRLISELRPNVHVKGGDYRVDSLPEYETLIAFGAEIRTLCYTENHSSSNVIKQIIRNYRNC
jgi:rfaE bifunctional protein nucleotidyltransferase chain/domain